MGFISKILFRILVGLIIYYTSMPARKEGNLLPDAGLLWHSFSRDQTTYAFRVDSSLVDGSQSVGPGGISYFWEQTNPVGSEDVKNLAEVFGSINCNGDCYKANFDADTDVDGSDVALLAKNMGAVNLSNADQATAQFVAGIARPHIFRLTISDGVDSTSETAIVAVHHPNMDEVLTAPAVDPMCLVP